MRGSVENSMRATHRGPIKGGKSGLLGLLGLVGGPATAADDEPLLHLALDELFALFLVEKQRLTTALAERVIHFLFGHPMYMHEIVH